MQKQVIVLRKDLNMRKGKMVAQGAHASMKALLDIALTLEMSIVEDHLLCIPLRPDISEWLEDKFTKIAVSVNSEEELVEIYNQAKEAGLLCSLITDAGLTEFNGVPTKTAVAVGPGLAEEIDKITGGLKLL